MTRTLRLVLVRNPEGGIIEAVHDDPALRVLLYVADEDTSKTDEVRIVTHPAGAEPVPMDVWAFDATANVPLVDAYTGAPTPDEVEFAAEKAEEAEEAEDEPHSERSPACQALYGGHCLQGHLLNEEDDGRGWGSGLLQEQLRTLVQEIASLKASLRVRTVEAERLILCAADDGAAPAGLVLQDRARRTRAELILDAEGAPQFVLNDARGNRRLAVQLSAAGEPSVYLWGSGPAHLATLRIDPAGDPELVMHAGVEKSSRTRPHLDLSPRGGFVPTPVKEETGPGNGAGGVSSPASTPVSATPSGNPTTSNTPGLDRSLPNTTFGGDGTPMPVAKASHGRIVLRAWRQWAGASDACVDLRHGIVTQRADLRMEVCAVLDGARSVRTEERGTRIIIGVMNGGSYPIDHFEFGAGTHAWDVEGQQHGMLGTPVCLDSYGKVCPGPLADAWRPHMTRHYLLWFPTLIQSEVRLRKLTIDECYRIDGRKIQSSWVLVIPAQ